MPQIDDIPTSPIFDPSDPSTLLTRSLPLLPFQNQVGGHCSFFRFSKRAICKPMSHKEQEFYEYLEHHHAPLLPFTSQYLGVVNVTYRSSNAQPMLPEVILAENQHLLANWKKYATTSANSTNHQIKQQQQQQQPRRPQQRRHSSSYKSYTNSFDIKNDIDSAEGDGSSLSKLQAPSWSPLTFKEQVLREVFLPDALQERLQQVQDWQRGMRQRQLEEAESDRIRNHGNSINSSGNEGQLRDPGKRSILQTSRSVLDFRRQRLEDDPPMAPSSSSSTNANQPHSAAANAPTCPLKLIATSIPIAEPRGDSPDYDDNANSNCVDTPSDLSGDHINAPQVTVHPRRPSLIDSTTSAPQTPRMRETKLHNPLIRPPPLTQSPIPNLTSSPSTMSLSPICLSPPLPPQSSSDNPAPHRMALQQLDQDERPQDSTNPSSESASWRPRKEPTNPWSVQMYQRDLEKVNVDDMQQFILIEDLTDDIKYPCVLDLKMGTRQVRSRNGRNSNHELIPLPHSSVIQHGVFSSTAKMQSQTKKCARSTSLQLGVRISGMQVYSLTKQQFLFEDKYKGRSLTPLGFRGSLVRYFDNGEGCHILHLPALIRKLALIYRIIQTMDSFRFYASSLLIIYDADNRKPPRRRIDVRLIDFAKSVTKHEWAAQQDAFTYPPERADDADEGSIGPDQGYLLGVQSLIACFTWIYIEHGGKKEDLGDDALQDHHPSWLYDDATDSEENDGTSDLSF